MRRVKEALSDGAGVHSTDLVKPYLAVMRGEALEQRQILALDDFSLSVLIDYFANDPAADVTVTDLGKRIIARDLFKIVPTKSQVIDEFIGQPEGFEKIYAAIKPFCAGNPRYYLVVDRLHFNMFAKNRSEASYFIDENREATAIKEHPLLQQYDIETHSTRLFTVAEAVESVRRLLG